MDGLDVRLVSRSDEANNWKDLSDSEDKKEETGGESQEATVAGIDVTNATLVYTDEAEKSVTRLTKLEVHTGALGQRQSRRCVRQVRLRRWRCRAGRED